MTCVLGQGGDEHGSVARRGSAAACLTPRGGWRGQLGEEAVERTPLVFDQRIIPTAASLRFGSTRAEGRQESCRYFILVCGQSGVGGLGRGEVAACLAPRGGRR